MTNDPTTPVPLVGEAVAGPAQEHRDRPAPTVNGSPKPEPACPVADDPEPADYGWTEQGYEVRQAIKEYSEQTHADD